MNRHSLIEAIESSGEFTFSRSSGPGGQHVNKVNTRVQLTVNLNDLTVLSASDRTRIAANLYGHACILHDREIRVQAQSERSQLANRKAAVQRMADIIMQAVRPAVRRKPTAPSRAAKQRRIDSKRANSRKKQLRRAVKPETDG